jgi:DNA-binding response OmpR family regulator
MSKSGLAVRAEALNTRPQVLLVDDEIDHLLPLADALHTAGFAACIATSRDEALFDVASSPPAAVVLDAEMADRMLLFRIRASAVMLPIVLTTTAPATDARIAALLAIAGVTHMAKPVEAQELLALLSNAGVFPRPTS